MLQKIRCFFGFHSWCHRWDFTVGKYNECNDCKKVEALIIYDDATIKALEDAYNVKNDPKLIEDLRRRAGLLKPKTLIKKRKTRL